MKWMVYKVSKLFYFIYTNHNEICIKAFITRVNRMNTSSRIEKNLNMSPSLVRRFYRILYKYLCNSNSKRSQGQRWNSLRISYLVTFRYYAKVSSLPLRLSFASGIVYTLGYHDPSTVSRWRSYYKWGWTVKTFLLVVNMMRPIPSGSSIHFTNSKIKILLDVRSWNWIELGLIYYSPHCLDVLFC